MSTKNHFLSVSKGMQSFRAGEEQMDKLLRLWLHRKGRCKTMSQTLRDVIDKQYDLEEPFMTKRLKKIKYKQL